MNNKKHSKMIRERAEKRGRYEKHYETEDHGCAVAVYPEAVHFFEDGEWKEIDNTLVEDGSGGYVNRASDMKVRFAGETGDGALVSIRKDGYEIRWELLKDAEKAENAEKAEHAGKAEHAEKAERPEGAEAAELAEDLKIEAVNVAAEETRHHFEPAAIIRRFKDRDEAADTSADPKQTTDPEDTDSKQTAKSVNGDMDEDVELHNLKRMTLGGGRSGGTYHEIFPGVDLEYRLEGDRLKENIILKTAEALKERVSFVLTHPGLQLGREQDGSLILYPEGKEQEPVFFLDAPYLYDVAGAVSAAVQYRVEEMEQGEGAKTGKTIVTLVSDRVWLESPERVLPVTIDPNVKASKKSTTIDDAFVCSARPDSAEAANYRELEVGRNSVNQYCRSFLKFNQLPELEKGAVVVGAYFNLWQYKYSANSGAAINIAAHRVTGSWSEASVTWNTQPSFESAAMDYKSIGALGTNQWMGYGFDVTKAVRGWYNDSSSNYGIVLKSATESTYAYGTFASSETPVADYGLTDEQYPTGVIYYRNTNGLESYYSYHEQSLGRTGTGYVNDFNGNLVFVHPDEGTSGCLLPLSFSHVYNLNECDRTSRFGKGWRLSFKQELKATGDTDYPYVLIDGDGTSHYFYKDTSDGNKLKDEDGLGLVITQTSSSNYDAYSIIEDKQGMKYIFGQDNFLRQIKDLNGNAQKAQYSPHADGNHIDYIDDPTGARALFTYNTDKTRLDTLMVNNRVTRFAYDSDGHLTGITYPDGKVSTFTYDGDLLVSAATIDGIKMEYQYTTDCNQTRVSQIREVGSSGTTGQCVNITYLDGSRTRFEEAGLDGSISSTADNRTFTYHFNRYGNPVSVSDDEGHTSSYQHYQEGMSRNKLKQSGSMGACVYNYLKNPGFDSTDEFADAWGNENTSGGAWGVTRKTDRGYFGDTSIKVSTDAADGYAAVIQNVSLEAGTYTLSAYAYAEEIVPASGGLGAVLGVLPSGSTTPTLGTETFTGTSDPDIDRGWKRLKMTFTISSAQTVKIYGLMWKATGSVWFDCFQLEKGSRANRYNMVYNSRFARGSGTAAEDWRIQNAQTGDGVTTDPEKGTCLKLTGDPSLEKYAVHAVYTSGEEGDVYSFGCYVKADAIPEKRFQIGAAVIYDSGDPKWELIDCDAYGEGWQYVSGIVSTDDENSVTTRTYNAIHFYVFYSNQMNAAYFTDIQLMKDNGPSYTYDSQGNLNTAKQSRQKDSFHYGQDNLLSRMAQMDGTAFEYTYDGKKRLLSAKSTEGVRYSYTYNEQGLPTSAVIQGDWYSTAVTVGRTYFIRQKRSGKYLDTRQGDVTGSNIHQYEYNGSADQQWKVEDAGDGYVKFIVQSGTATRALDVANGADADGTNVQLYDDDGTQAQKFRLKPVEGGGYLILAKCSNDVRGLHVADNSLDNFGNVQTDDASDESNASLVWYFEPADESLSMGSIYRFRARHSGQYLGLENGETAVGTRLVQQYRQDSRAQQFRQISSDESGYCYLSPMHATDRCLDISTVGSDGYYRVSLQDISAADSRKFQIISQGDGTYVIQNKEGLQFDLMHGSYEEGTDVIGTGSDGSEPADNKRFVLESASAWIGSSMTYSEDGRNVQTVTDARGCVTTNTYDADNRLLTSVTDPRGNTTAYTYDGNTDRLLKVTASVGGEERSVVYTYDGGDRLKSILHNGTEYQFVYDDLGRRTQVTVAGTEMENYGYLPGNGPLQTVTYANGEVLTNVFDRQNRLVGQKWNGTTISSCEYDDSGLLMKKTDTAEGITCEYGYDMTGRLVSQRTSHGQELEIGYDDRNRVSSLVQKLDSAKVKTKYLYGDPEAQQKPGLLYGMEVDGNKRQSIQYDSLGRKRLVYLHLNDGAYRYHGYQYESNAASGTTHLLPRYYTVDGGWYWYKYDEAGNIVTLSHKDGETTKVIYYQYDSLNQLIRENNQVLDKTICYTYDLGGNLTMRSEYAYTTGSLSGKTAVAEYPYTYRSAGWKDQLVSYNSQAITYDDMGNPLSWKGKGLTWEKGRRLSKISNADGSTLAAFGYDSEGNRVRKTVAASGVTTRYYLNGGKLVGMKQGNQTVQFVYDPDGAPFLMRVNGVDYYYLFNGQGDVTGLVDKSNNLVVSYVYDSWGKPISTSGSDADGIGSLNPLRYRGYVWDAESGLYYMGSRYYDPEVGRFLNVDRIVSSIGGAMQGYNLYAYCFDNPVNRTDSSGNWPEWLEEFGKELERRAKHTVDIFGRILMSPLNALELEIGVGYGYGMEISKDITGKDLSVDAGLKIREAIICSSKGVDIVSTASVGVDTSIINDRIGFSNMVGIEHSFSAPNCECGVFASVQERLQCPANEPMKSFGSNAGLGWGLYYMVGADFNINFDWKAWGEELVEIFHDSLKY